ncbi:unnamed protein product [Moneuplotes crassus]|uniref:Uncharacterized protein n=1 Tax=Euplotes crassus TaxID=5936 RepID=A0AAD1UHU0_EUPCR|nr:unnamed protein product [Moneuplotes crassus]
MLNPEASTQGFNMENPNASKHLSKNFLLNTDTKTLDLMKHYLTSLENPEKAPEGEGDKSEPDQAHAQTMKQLNHVNSLFELSSRRKLERMRASNPILNLESKQEELYSVQQAIGQLGGLSDTLKPLQESLTNNEIANIKNKVRKGNTIGPELDREGITPNLFATAPYEPARTDKYLRPKDRNTALVETVSHFTYNKGDVMNILFDKANKECSKRREKLNKIKKWNDYNTLKDQGLKELASRMATRVKMDQPLIPKEQSEHQEEFSQNEDDHLQREDNHVETLQINEVVEDTTPEPHGQDETNSQPQNENEENKLEESKVNDGEPKIDDSHMDKQSDKENMKEELSDKLEQKLEEEPVDKPEEESVDKPVEEPVEEKIQEDAEEKPEDAVNPSEKSNEENPEEDVGEEPPIPEEIKQS